MGLLVSGESATHNQSEDTDEPENPLRYFFTCANYCRGTERLPGVPEPVVEQQHAARGTGHLGLSGMGDRQVEAGGAVGRRPVPGNSTNPFTEPMRRLGPEHRPHGGEQALVRQVRGESPGRG